MKNFINKDVVFRSFGISISLVGFFMLTAIPFAIYFNEENIAFVFIISALISLTFGQFFIFINKNPKNTEIGERDAYIVVTLTWFMVGFFGSLPFFISSAIPCFTDAYFEAISGFTTTGASILKDIESMPKSILYWRSLMQWLGGMGILVLVIAVLPSVGLGGVKLFVAEAPGPTTTKLHPKIRNTAIKLWQVYFGLTVLLTVLLMLGKMSFFESVCHAFSTMSTGGFSPKNTSIAHYSSYIQIIITIFMFFGGLNFALHYFLIKGKILKVVTNEELVSYLLFIVFAAIIISGILFYNGNYDNLQDSLIHSFFQTVSIITTTGFATADYMIWPQVTWFLLLFLFFIGGMIGSTGGNIKFTRLLVLVKNIRAEVKKILHPRAMVTIKLNQQTIPDEVVRNFFIVFVAFIVVFCLGSVTMSLFIEDPKEAMGATIACLGNIGPAFGQFGPAGNYANLNDAGKWILGVLMVVGRLEIIPVMIFFHFAFWRK